MAPSFTAKGKFWKPATALTRLILGSAHGVFCKHRGASSRKLDAFLPAWQCPLVFRRLIHVAHQLPEIRGHLGLKSDLLPAEGMLERNRPGMKRQKRVVAVFPAVFLIAHNRVSNAREMDAYLVFSTRQQPDIE